MKTSFLSRKKYITDNMQELMYNVVQNDTVNWWTLSGYSIPALCIPQFGM